MSYRRKLELIPFKKYGIVCTGQTVVQLLRVRDFIRCNHNGELVISLESRLTGSEAAMSVVDLNAELPLPRFLCARQLRIKIHN